MDPEQRTGFGRARTALRNASGREIWSRVLDYSLRDAEITERGEIVGWALRTENPDSKDQLGIVILDHEGKERNVDWLPDSARNYVKSIAVASTADIAVVRLDQIRGDVFTGHEREEWQTVRISTGERLQRFVPHLLQREGIATLRRVFAVRSTPLICCEAWFGSNGEALVEVLDLQGEQVWSVALEETRPLNSGYFAWMGSAERLSTTGAGEFTFQRIRPDERIRWRVVERSEAPGTWNVTEVSRDAHPLQVEAEPGVVVARPFTPKLLSERPLATSPEGKPCSVGTWSDAAIDGQGQLLVLEVEDSHLHHFDAQGESLDRIELREAGKYVDRILGTRKDRFDLAVGDSFSTWSGSGERLTEAYDRWHHALARPTSHAVEGARWFIDTNEVLRYADDDPRAAVTTRLARHPDGTWFGRLEGGAVAQDGTLVTVDVQLAGLFTIGPGQSTISRFDAAGLGMDQFRARLGSARYLSTRGRWLAGNGYGVAACFLADLDAQQVYGLSGEFNSWNFRVLLPPAEGEFWIVDLRGKRLLRAALPEK